MVLIGVSPEAVATLLGRAPGLEDSFPQRLTVAELHQVQPITFSYEDDLTG